MIGQGRLGNVRAHGGVPWAPAKAQSAQPSPAQAQSAQPRPRLRATAPRHSRPLLALLVLIALLAGVWLWLRDSSLVAVKRVSVSVQSGPDQGRIRSALIAAARTMTTLDVGMGELQMAIAPYPVVKHLRVSTQFPHGMRIDVIEQAPVATVLARGRTVAMVAGDGTLMRDATSTGGLLPAIALPVAPGGPHLTDRAALGAVAALAAAPFQLLARISQVSTIRAHGVVAQLRDGPSIYFGAPTRLQAKWSAAVAALADPGSAGASYVDVTDPDRPAAGAEPSSGGG